MPIDVFKNIFQNPVIGYHVSKQIKYMKQDLSVFECKQTIDLDDLKPPMLVIGNVNVFFFVNLVQLLVYLYFVSQITSSFMRESSLNNNQESSDKRRKRDNSNIKLKENDSPLNQTIQTQLNMVRQANITENVQEVFKHNHFDVFFVSFLNFSALFYLNLIRIFALRMNTLFELGKTALICSFCIPNQSTTNHTR